MNFKGLSSAVHQPNDGVTDFKKSIPTDENNQIDFTSLTHPDYDQHVFDWDRYRSVFEGGREFVNRYLLKFSKREESDSFEQRKSLTYVPSHARTAVLEMRNAIFKRLVDIKRLGGPTTYQIAVKGERGGVDRVGSSMDSFMGIKILTELMTMMRVGVYVDKPSIPIGATRGDDLNISPFLYYYKAEDIRSWGHDSDTGELTAVLLRDHTFVVDPETNLPVGYEPRYRFLRKLNAELVLVRIYDKHNVLTEEHHLELPRIPFVIGEISESILTDVVDHQIGLLNLASSDMSYLMKSNYPFYIEQYEPATEMLANLTGSFDGCVEPGTDGAETAEGTSQSSNEARSKLISTGAATGRGYARGLDAPSFISPPTDPVEASMKKQNEIKQEIRELVSLSVAGLGEGGGLEAGLAYLGLQLESMEKAIAEIWDHYEGTMDRAIVSYPSDYQVKSDKERLEIAKQELEFIDKIPSLSYQKQMAKDIISITIGHKTDAETLKQMCEEVDEATIVVIDPDVLDQDLENGLVDMQTASLARLYPKGSVQKATAEKAARAAFVGMAQNGGSGAVNPATGGARGVPDIAVFPREDAKREKDISQKEMTDIDGVERTRGSDSRTRKPKRK